MVADPSQGVIEGQTNCARVSRAAARGYNDSRTDVRVNAIAMLAAIAVTTAASLARARMRRLL